MLTLFTIPKAFSGRIGLLQANAIGSWVRLNANCEVILFGDDPGVAEAAARFGVRHESQVTRTPQGTPVLSDIFARADAIARHPLLCFVNSDIILFNDVVTAARMVAARYRHFLMVSSRFNLRIQEVLAFGPDWDRDLRARPCTKPGCTRRLAAIFLSIRAGCSAPFRLSQSAAAIGTIGSCCAHGSAAQA